MSRTLALAAAAIALGFAAIVAAIAVVTAPEPSSPASAAAPAEPPAEAASAPVTLEPSVAATAAPAAGILGVTRPPGGAAREFALPPSIPTPAPRTRPAWLQGSTQQLAPRHDPTPLGPLRPYVAAGMSRLQVAVAACADEAPPGAAPPARRGRVTLTLKLEALDNEVRVVDATLPDDAAAEDWRVSCAQRKLRGQRIHAPSTAGPRFEIPFVLNL